jgi:hypothetical protein
MTSNVSLLLRSSISPHASPRRSALLSRKLHAGVGASDSRRRQHQGLPLETFALQFRPAGAKGLRFS